MQTQRIKCDLISLQPLTHTLGTVQDCHTAGIQSPHGHSQGWQLSGEKLLWYTLTYITLLACHSHTAEAMTNLHVTGAVQSSYCVTVTRITTLKETEELTKEEKMSHIEWSGLELTATTNTEKVTMLKS